MKGFKARFLWANRGKKREAAKGWMMTFDRYFLAQKGGCTEGVKRLE